MLVENYTTQRQHLQELLSRSGRYTHHVVSPYRINPLGAHVDHQGGSVLARTIDQYSLLSFDPQADSSMLTLRIIPSATDVTAWPVETASFVPGDTEQQETWIRYAQSAAAVFRKNLAVSAEALTFDGQLSGTQVGAGLSSSASVVLAYLTAFSAVSNCRLDDRKLIELSRQVENDFMGLNNGIQDQMSIVFGRPDALSCLNMNTVSAEPILDPPNSNDVSWLICYSGYSRELVGSGFNTRVAECRQAAASLDRQANILGEVAEEQRSEAFIRKLPADLANRARHFYTELERVNAGCEAWRQADWQTFGALMNQSCHSSMTQYEVGSQPLVDLHELASGQSNVYGSRFGGGGYGGCLIMLVDANKASELGPIILDAYLARHPDRRDRARWFVAHAESRVRLVTVDAE